MSVGSANNNKLSLVGIQLPEKYKENFKFSGLNVEILRSGCSPFFLNEDKIIDYPSKLFWGLIIIGLPSDFSLFV
jgi:hypothetical protein